jgi:hypothetical protein
LYGLFFCDRFKLISINLQKKSRRQHTTNGGEKNRKQKFSGQNSKQNVCKPSFIRTIPSTPEFHRVMHLDARGFLPPIGNWNFHSSPCPEGCYSIVALSINFLIFIVNQIVKFIAKYRDLIRNDCVENCLCV